MKHKQAKDKDVEVKSKSRLRRLATQEGAVEKQPGAKPLDGRATEREGDKLRQGIKDAVRALRGNK